MSRSGYIDDYDQDYPNAWALWRGRVASAIRGKRGQAFLRELAAAMDAMPNKRLIVGDLRKHGEVCTIGVVGAARGVDMERIDPDDYAAVAAVFKVAAPLVQEIEFENDEAGKCNETPEERWTRMRSWVGLHIRPDGEAR